LKTARLLCAAVLAAALLTACSSSSDGNAVPRDWIGREYSAGSPGYLDRSDSPAKVADEIHRHTAAQDRTTGDNMVFLRYRDDIVAISPYQGGSRIEIDDYRTGHSRWHSYVGTRWPAPDSRSFRGGGPGSGK